jgi:prolipoprotein diacylglyceryltransferase
MSAYGIWRFIVEYARDDYRGSTFISFLTPSQLTAIIMIIGGGILYFIMRKLRSNSKENVKDSRENPRKDNIVEDGVNEQ